MSKTRTAKAVVCAMVCVLSLTTYAEETSVPAVSDEPALGVGVSTAFMSKYIWRGQLLNDDYVMQPSVGLTYGNWSASLWGNVDMTDYHDNDWEFTEYDWTIGYSDKIPGVDILSYSVGAIYYYFPSLTDDGDTVEVYAGLGLDIPLSPTLTMYRDVDEIDGTYLALSVSHSIETIFELSPDMPVGMNLSASTGWGSENYNKGYWGVNSSKMNDLTLSVGFPVVMGNWTITPSVSYVTLLSSGVRASDWYKTNSGNNDSDYVFTGITLSTSF